MRQYNLGFVSDKDIYEHVRETVHKYRRSINLEEFNKNIVDPIKLLLDSKIYGQTIKETINTECLRQIDKSNNNCIGYFHQYIFRYAGNGWEVPRNGQKGGFDVLNERLHIYAEIKNKHNTMNYASASDTYAKMQNKLLTDDRATCYLVEVIAKGSHLQNWNVSLKNRDGSKSQYSHERIKRISMDRFYSIVFADDMAFCKLCRALPDIIDDVLKDETEAHIQNSVYKELGGEDLYKELFLLAFNGYNGFDKF